MTDDVRRGVIGAGVLGFGFSALIDVVVLHLILRLHHLVSNRYPVSTVPGLRTNVLADGLLSLGAILVMGVGAGLLWRAERRADRPLPVRSLAGAAIIGIGGFDLFDVVVNHTLLGLHHATHGSSYYDPHWFVVSVLIVVAGVLVYRGGDRAGGSGA
ncbi:DUF2243 domain-containing protein [halophilic archaeon]|nr:DUF2243 domain-containing protein [halophilic archaeon]